MSAHGETRQRAYEAACHLAANGERPSVAAIRRALDGKGGQQAIQQGFHDWLAEAARRFQAPELPAEIQEPVLRLWQAASALAESHWADAKASFETRIADLEALLGTRDMELSEARHAAEALREAVADRQERLGNTQDSLDILQHEADQLRENLDARTRELSQATADREEQQRQRERLEGVLAEARASLSYAQEELATLRRDIDVEKARSELLATAEAAGKETLAQARKDLETSRRDAERLHEAVSLRDAQISQLTMTIQAEQQGRDADTLHWTGLVEDVRAQLKDANEREVRLAAEKRDLSSEIRHLRSTIARLQPSQRRDSSATGAVGHGE